MRCTVAMIALLGLLAAPLLAAEPPDAKDLKKQLRDIQMKVMRARFKAYRENADLKKMSDQIADARKNLEATKLAIPEYKKLSDEAAAFNKKAAELRDKIRKLDAKARDVLAKSDVGKVFTRRRGELQKQLDEALLGVDEIKKLTDEVKAAVDAGAAAAGKVGEVVTVHIIPRPHEELSQAVPQAPAPKPRGGQAKKG